MTDESAEPLVGSSSGATFDVTSGRFRVGNAPARVLLVEDDDQMREIQRRIMAKVGMQVVAAAGAREALDLLGRDMQFDAIVTDIVMPGMDGLAMMREVRRHDLDVPIVLVTGNPSLDSAVKAMEYGGFRYLAKPFEPSALREIVREAVHLHRLARLKREALELAEAFHAQLGDRASLEVHFEEALQALWVAFQPIVDWPRRTVFGYEALVRSSEPTLNTPPLLFDAAERLGRVSDIGRRVRELVAAAIPTAHPDVTFFVNLHPTDLQDDHLSDPGSPLSRESHRVVLEVTERKSLDSIAGVSERISALRALGFRLAVDDLGAGYAGLASFNKLEPEVVKLDMSLIRGIDRSPRQQSLVRSMITVCEGELGMPVVCEGVETEQERDTLMDLGATLLQGFLLGRPAADLVVPELGQTPAAIGG